MEYIECSTADTLFFAGPWTYMPPSTEPNCPSCEVRLLLFSVSSRSFLASQFIGLFTLMNITFLHVLALNRLPQPKAQLPCTTSSTLFQVIYRAFPPDSCLLHKNTCRNDSSIFIVLSKSYTGACSAAFCTYLPVRNRLSCINPDAEILLTLNANLFLIKIW